MDHPLPAQDIHRQLFAQITQQQVFRYQDDPVVLLNRGLKVNFRGIEAGAQAARFDFPTAIQKGFPGAAAGQHEIAFGCRAFGDDRLRPALPGEQYAVDLKHVETGCERPG